MNNQMIPIGKLFEIEKGELQSTKCTPGEYDFITAAEDWKTHNKYSHECEALIFAAAASGSLGRTHYVDGKFTTSDLCYILSPKDEATYPLNLSFYHFVFNSLRPTLVAATKSGTSKESINQTNFKNYEIPYFDIELQDFWIEKLKNTLGLKDLLGGELTHQQTLLKKLRQQILQEAIEGKLTAEWRVQNPDVEPASELLKRIAAEKAQLVRDRKIKLGKKQPASEHYNDEISVPDVWVHPDLEDITQYITDGTHQTPNYTVSGRIFLSAQNVKPFRFMPENHRFVSESAYENYIKNKSVEKDDLLIGRVGAGIGETAVVDIDIECAIYVSLGLVKTFKKHTNSDYLAIVFNSPYGIRYSKGNISSGGGSAGNFNLGRIRSFKIPLPSRDEQKAIVTKVEKLLAFCDQLEIQITQNQAHAEHLMQAVLKEAFSHDSEADSPLAELKAAAHA